MADDTKSTPVKTESKAETPKAASSTPVAATNGKGDAPRNCFTDQYRSNFDGIDWGR